MSAPLTRAQAIATGALVDVSHLSNWRRPAACSVALFTVINDAVIRYGYTIPDIILDFRFQIIRAAEKQPTSSVLYFDVTLGNCTHRLKVTSGHGDTAEDVITLLLAKED